MANRLKKETSPYLLQHKDNPVDWYPWGPEALEKAKKEDKPILLSIGYSSCHWCHVMEKECFENPDIAKLMNDHFINVKVDREERPDLDQVYQGVAQALTQSGGWPLTVFLTPELKPFFGGTYFPPDDRYGRPGFSRVLNALTEAFRSERKSVEENASKLSDWIRDVDSQLVSESRDQKELPTYENLKSIVETLVERVDPENGGLGHAPKFPNTMLLSFMWRYGISQDMESARIAVLQSLRKMARGGIYDQLGGGFHRYSVDAAWRVPHFEKMLYDNGLLLRLYSEVFLTGEQWLEPADEKLFLRVLKGIKNYLVREMADPKGGLYSSQDADSEGEEGKFFVWTHAELQSALTSEELEVLSHAYGVTETGNFELGRNILISEADSMELAHRLKKNETKVVQHLESAEKKLFEIRSQRIKPQLDHKVIVGWNGLAVSGLLWASHVFRYLEEESEAQECVQLAKRVFGVVSQPYEEEPRCLASTIQLGKQKGLGYLDDFSFMAEAALNLSRFAEDSTECQRYLELAERWIAEINTSFRESSEQPGYFLTSKKHEALIQRPRSVYDQAIPSGTAVTLESMLVLASLSDSPEARTYQKEVESQLRHFFPKIKDNPYGFGQMLCLSLMMVQGPVSVSGDHAAQYCWHPSIFQKPKRDQQKGWVVCHLATCSQPLQESEDVSAQTRQHLLAKTASN